MVGGLALAGVASAAVFTGAAGDVYTRGTNAATSVQTETNATVLRVAEGGVGHMLLVPYFSAQNGNMSVFHVLNSDTVNGKVVKVRFRSAANSDDILDFQVFLSPGDVWTASVAAGADGTAELKTSDNTCTRPAIALGQGIPFVTTRLDATRLGADGVKNQTREGYVEVFTMADIPGPVSGAPATPLFTAIKHVSGLAPCSVNAPVNATNTAAAALLDAVSVTNWADGGAAAFGGLDTPSTGLSGDWYIINVPQTTTFSGAATSVVALTNATATGVPGRGNFVHFPQDEGAVAVANAELWTADPLFRVANVVNNASVAPTTRALESANYDFPDMSTPYVTPAGTAVAPLEQAATLTAALAVQSITNQYANDTSITAKTDWVFSMPTRRYSVAANYAVTDINVAGYRLFSDLVAGGATTNWFRPNTGAATTDGNTSIRAAGTGLICVTATGDRFWDREETTPGATTSKPVFSPSRPGVTQLPQFCGETSVLAIGDTGNSVLAASVARDSITSPGAGAAPYQNGWYQMTTTNGGAGLPILGAAFIKLTNPNVGNGVSGTYGITWPHRFTR